MGYRTLYNGKIEFNPQNKILVYLLKFLKKRSSPYDYISSSSRGVTDYWFHLEDEWLGYCLPLDIINCEKGELDFDGDNDDMHFKDYCDGTLTLLFIISHLDKTVKGQVWWDGDDNDDNGTIKIRKGQIIRKPKGINQKVINIKDMIKISKINIYMGSNYRDNKDTIHTPKIDILNFLKDIKKDISFEEFKKSFESHMIVEML